MKKFLLILFFICFVFANGWSQSDSLAISEILKFRTELNQFYGDSSTTPLLKEDFDTFHTLNFFDIDLSYRVMAELIVDTASSEFEMKTSTARKPKFRKYGDLVFVLKNQNFKLPLYQNIGSKNDTTDAIFLFFPFTDITSGESVYGGGRYLDFKITNMKSVLLDFNQCYQPYCAYNHRYSCPIPPLENHINIEVKAGVKMGLNNKILK